MPLAAAATPEHVRARNADRQPRWREGGAKLDRARRHNSGDDIRQPIAAGEPLTDNLDQCDAKWARLLGAQRYVDAAIRRAVVGVYEPAE